MKNAFLWKRGVTVALKQVGIGREPVSNLFFKTILQKLRSWFESNRFQNSGIMRV